MRCVLVLVALVGCGRIDFDALASRGDGAGDNGSGSDGRGDGDGGAGGDAIQPGCGNTVCEGATGELCSTCMADCAVTADVCGNGECSAAEVGTCVADCGPTPWTWAQEDIDLLTEINNARTGGVKCPGDATVTTAPAFAMTTSMQVGVREYAWEIAHEQYFMNGGVACNGRTFNDRQAPYGGNGGLAYNGGTTAATVADAVTAWKQSALLCPALMNSFATQATAAVAHDKWSSFAVWWK